MPKRIANGLTLLSAVVCVLSLMLVGRSFFRADFVDGVCGVATIDGHVIVLVWARARPNPITYASEAAARFRDVRDTLWRSPSPSPNGAAPRCNGVRPPNTVDPPRNNGVSPHNNGVAPPNNGVSPRNKEVLPRNTGDAPRINGVSSLNNGVLPRNNGDPRRRASDPSQQRRCGSPRSCPPP